MACSSRRTILLTLAMLAAARPGHAAQLTAADRADLARIETYLNGVRTLKARFLQIAPDGATSEGVAWIDRPGKLRFEYDPPSPLLLIVGYGVGFLIDRQLQQTNNFPVVSSPLSIFLSEKVTFSGDIAVDAVMRQPGQIQVTVHQAKSSGDGKLTLVFADQPLALRQWAVLDAQQRETRVSLFNVELGGTFDPKLFQNADAGNRYSPLPGPKSNN